MKRMNTDMAGIKAILKALLLSWLLVFSSSALGQADYELS